MKNKDTNRRITVLCNAINAVGHINATLGVACALKKRNHRVIFVTERSWKGKFARYGFEEEIYDEKNYLNGSVNEDDLVSLVARSVEHIKKPAIEQIYWVNDVVIHCLEKAKFAHKRFREIVAKVKPDVIIVDNVVPNPSFIETNLPLVYINSGNPLYAIDDERLPPCISGLPVNDKSEWNSFRKTFNKSRKIFWTEINEWLKEFNIPPVPKFRFRHVSTNLNVYIYPKPLMEDYLRLCRLGEEWIGLDHSIRESKEKFALPPNFEHRNGKLIYLSMGSLGSNIVELMSRLVKILSKCEHKIIVVRGKFQDQYELADNMWGDAFLPQLEILPLVDLVITHGGNNTFIETLYFAKPMIILPLFGDQHDNAQRAVETKIAFKFNPFNVEENELLSAIEKTLNDCEMIERIQNISKQMRESKTMDSIVQRIEKIAENPKIPPIM